ncbi:uncharacterized protein BJ212DRAFT_1481628 [Suillus subaureus]|uniref:Protein kinase domain-containing protein n=1 Tax=Suillus subaureus TaxID=48587 RepID=A0A9P7JCT2_9AGAM|nr:uncharacterized protein BJ212DRAFT_1481628 [Suillus subaureus]KAG1815098.1 hypothetical protein BJ212DRAFT_1481628 [Suillus subaureus]
MDLEGIVGVFLRDVQPEKIAMGVWENSHIVYYFMDFGLAKLYADPSTGTHGVVKATLALELRDMQAITCIMDENKDDETILKHWASSYYFFCMDVRLSKAPTHQASRPNYFEWGR